MTTETRVTGTPGTTVEERLADLERAVEDLGRQIGDLADEAVYPAELSVLPGLELRRPIPIIVEESADDAVARWIEPAITGLGRSEGEAVESLAEVIVEVWTELRSDDARLSRNARRMLSVIEAYVAPAA